MNMPIKPLCERGVAGSGKKDVGPNNWWEVREVDLHNR